MINVYLESLGCAKNLVDSEMMLGLLQQHHFVIVEDPAQAEVIVVNTCGFIDDAKKESIDTILQYSEYKKAGSCRYLVACGCLTQRYRDELPELLPEVDAFLGVEEYHKIAQTIGTLYRRQLSVPENIGAQYINRRLLTGNYTAYLKVAEGCDNNCTYCAIPLIRGPRRSRPMDELLKEAKVLADKGIKELIVIAQDTSAYGLDLYGETKLADLLARLCELPFTWIRFLYCYPTFIDDKLLQVVSEQPKICRYFDIPLQHIADNVLRRMGRRGDRSLIEEKLNSIRAKLPDAALRTTFMVGFSGETETDFAKLLDFCRQYRFDWAGSFCYSQQEGTPAERLDDDVPQQEKERRRDILMRELAQISEQNLKKYLHLTLDILIEAAYDEDKGIYIGRSRYHAPDVDGIVYVESDAPLSPGEIVRVKITGSDVYDLTGEVVNDD